MQVSSPFSYQRICFSRLLGALIITVFLVAAMRGTNTHAAGGHAHFSIAPTFFPGYHARSRAYFMYDTGPNALIQDSVHVTNIGLVRGTVDLYPVDAITSSTSGTELLTHNDPRHDVGAWILLSRQRVTLNPGQSLDVPFRLHIPPHVRPGQHGGGIVAEEETPQVVSSSAHAVQMSIRLGSRLGLGVLLNLPGRTVEQLEAENVNYDTESTYQRLLIGLENTGTQLLHPRGTLQVMNEQGRQLQRVSLKLDTFMPQTTIHYPAYISHQALNPGIYTAKLRLEYEHNHLLNYTTRFVVPFTQLRKHTTISHMVADFVTLKADDLNTITPWLFVVGLALLVFVFSMFFFWKQKRSKASRRLGDNVKNKNVS